MPGRHIRERVRYAAPLALVSMSSDSVLLPKKERSITWGETYFVTLAGEVELGSVASFRSAFGQPMSGSKAVVFGDTVTVRFMTSSKSGPRFLELQSYALVRRDASEVQNEESGAHRFRVHCVEVDASTRRMNILEEREGDKMRTGDALALQSVKDSRLFLSVRGSYIRTQSDSSADWNAAFRVKVLPARFLQGLVARAPPAPTGTPDVIYEFQRFYRTEWNTPRLAGDPPHFADAQGTVDYGNVQTVDELGEWVVDRSGDGDAEGWEYAHSFDDLRDTAAEAAEEEEEREEELRALRGETPGADRGSDFQVAEVGAEEEAVEAGAEGGGEGKEKPLAVLSAKRLRRSSMAQRGQAAGAAASMLPLALRGSSSSSVLRAVTGTAPAESVARRRRWVRRGTEAEAQCTELAAARREAAGEEGEQDEQASVAGSAVSGVRARSGSFSSAGKGAVLQRIVANMCDPQRGLADSRPGGAAPGEPALVFTYGALLHWMQGLHSLRDAGSAGLQHVVTQLVAKGLVAKYGPGGGVGEGGNNPFAHQDLGAAHVGGSSSSLTGGDEGGRGGASPYVGSWRPTRATMLCVPEDVAERVSNPGGPRSLASRSVASAMRALGGAGNGFGGGRHASPGAVPEATHEEEEEEDASDGGSAAGARADTGSVASAGAANPVEEARQTRRVWSGAWVRTTAPDPGAANGAATTSDAHCARVCLFMTGGQLEVYPHGTLRLTGDTPRTEPLLRLPADAIVAVRSVWDEDLARVDAAEGAAGAAGEGGGREEKKEEEEQEEEEQEEEESAVKEEEEEEERGENKEGARGAGKLAPGPRGGQWDPSGEAAAAASQRGQRRDAALRLWRLGQSPWRWLEITFDPSARSGEARSRIRGTRRASSSSAGHSGEVETLWIAPSDLPRVKVFQGGPQEGSAGDARYAAFGKPANVRSEFDILRQLLLDVQRETSPAQRAFQLAEARRVAATASAVMSSRSEWSAAKGVAQKKEEAAAAEREVVGDLVFRAEAAMGEMEAALEEMRAGDLAREYTEKIETLVTAVAERRQEVKRGIEKGKQVLESTTQELEALVEDMRAVSELQLQLTALYSQPVFPQSKGTATGAFAHGVQSLARNMGSAALKLSGLESTAQAMQAGERTSAAATQARDRVTGAAAGAAGAVSGVFSGSGEQTSEKRTSASGAAGEGGDGVGVARGESAATGAGAAASPAESGEGAAAEGDKDAGAERGAVHAGDVEEGGAALQEGEEEEEEPEVDLPLTPAMKEDHRPVLRALLSSMLVNLALFAWVYFGI